MRESVIEQYLVDRVKALGGEVRKVKWIGRRGAPDRLVMLPTFRLHHEQDSQPTVRSYLDKVEAVIAQELGVSGRTIWVELKAPGEKPKPHQAREHKRMRRMGQRVEVVDTFARVEQILAELAA